MAVVGFLVANTGLPVIQPVDGPRGKDLGKPFLCQDRPCGCMSADECLRGCCCFSASQRLAWAHEHDVEAPAELLAEAKHEQRVQDEHGHGDNCCAADATKTLATKSTASRATAAACATCDEAHADAGLHPSDNRPEDGGWRVTLIVGRMAGQCRGLGPLSVLAFSALPPCAVVSYQFDWRPTGRVVFASPKSVSHSLQPPLRPPCCRA